MFSTVSTGDGAVGSHNSRSLLILVEKKKKIEHMVAGTHKDMNMKFKDVDLADKAVIFFMH